MRWQPYQHIIFDFDSTLTTIEGVDVLAGDRAAQLSVEALTQQAMNGSLSLEEVYARRLQTIQPTRAAVRALREIYKKHLAEDAAEVIAALQHLGHSVYIVSGGLIEPIAEVAVALHVPREHVFAVDLEYDQLAGQWWTRAGDAERFAHERYLRPRKSALQTSGGKSEIIAKLLHGKRGQSLLVGDGITDLMASSTVDLFLAFAGTVTRSTVVEAAPAALHTPSLAPVLILAAGPAAVQRLAKQEHIALYRKARRLINQDALVFRDNALAKKFADALSRAIPTQE